MLQPKGPYVSKGDRIRERRRQRQEASAHVFLKCDSDERLSDDESMDDDNEHELVGSQDPMLTDSDVLCEHDSSSDAAVYKPDDDDNVFDDNLRPSFLDLSSPLYENSHVSTTSAATDIMSFAIEFNLAKSTVDRLLQLLKSLLPTPNSLPTTHASIIKMLGAAPVSSSKYYCNCCHEICSEHSGRKICTNQQCRFVDRPLRNRELSEVVTMDIKAQLKSIISCNFSFFDQREFFPSFDITSGDQYQHKTQLVRRLIESSGDVIHPITLNIHADGAPLVRTTKSCLWPCFASIVELPPRLREMQSNIVVLCLWASSKKPDVDLFLSECIQQLIDLACPFPIIVNNEEFCVNVSTQLFLSDLPAKALLWKTINYNGYSACTNCVTEGVWHKGQVLYPYKKNSYRRRTHATFMATARAADTRSSGQKKGGVIDGVKGISPLLKIFEYPTQIVLDYMHLCCIGHMSTLIQRWLPMLTPTALLNIDSCLSTLQFPHNMSVTFNYPLCLSNDWKAKHFRVFLLSIGVPCMLPHLPPLIASHFALYSMCIKLLHCPKSSDEIQLSDKLIHYYCQTAPQIYGDSIELFSLHSHLHLPQQVQTHGGLCVTSAFCFESAIRNLKKKVHGTCNLATQIADWINIETLVRRPSFKLSTPIGVSSIDIHASLFDKYRKEFFATVCAFNQKASEVILFLRYKQTFVTYHTLIYDLPFTCSSYIISYRASDSSIQYGQIIIFYKYCKEYYAFVQHFEPADEEISDFVSVPKELEAKLNELFPLRRLSKSFVVVPIVNFVHKCIRVPFRDNVCLSEIRVDYEHD